MLKKILIALAVTIVVFAVVVAFQPDEYRVVRSATIAAPPAAVFPHVSDFRKWEAWSPWEKLDPAMKRTHEGTAGATGSVYAWAGNKEVGEGRMTLTETRPNEVVKIKLDFLKPFESSSDVNFTFKPEGNQTTVTWDMAGKKNYVMKACCLVMNMDKHVGGDFEKGLAQLKSVAESRAKN